MTSNHNRSRKQFWEDHMARWNATELSQVEYCRRNRISIKSFQYWRRKSERNFAPPALVELSAPKSLPVSLLSGHAELCLVVNQQYRIEIGKGFDPEDLERVVRVLGRI